MKLILRPEGGLGNRIRAIASARRLAANRRCELEVVWDWGQFYRFFERSQDFTVQTRSPVDVTVVHRHLPKSVNPDRFVPRGDVVFLSSAHVFWGEEEQAITLKQLLPHVPALNQALRDATKAFASLHRLPTTYVGLHMRRTDNKTAARMSGDDAFIVAAEQVLANGWQIFLATDNSATQAMMSQRFPVLRFPKRAALQQRWPRPFDASATEDDLIELHLLAHTHHVFGSAWSSYSELAMAMNGSSESRIIKS